MAAWLRYQMIFAGMSIGAFPARSIDGGTLMRYVLLCYDDERAWGMMTELERQQAIQDAVQLAQQLKARGQNVFHVFTSIPGCAQLGKE
jgi:hypothetical protein